MPMVRSTLAHRELSTLVLWSSLVWMFTGSHLSWLTSWLIPLTPGYVHDSLPLLVFTFAGPCVELFQQSSAEYSLLFSTWSQLMITLQSHFTLYRPNLLVWATVIFTEHPTHEQKEIRAPLQRICSYRGCLFSSTASRSFQNHTLFRPRGTGRAPGSRGVCPFSFKAFLYVCIPAIKNNNTRCPGMRLQNRTWSAWM